MATSMAFQPGHCLQLAVTSSLFPAYDLNPNTGAPVGEDLPSNRPSQTIYHSVEYPSHLLLPVVNDEKHSFHAGRRG